MLEINKGDNPQFPGFEPTSYSFPVLATGISASVPKDTSFHAAVDRIATEFSSTPDVFGSNLTISLQTDGEAVATDPTNHQKGAEIFRFEDDGEKTVAIGVIKYYSWESLKRQLGFGIQRDPNGKITSLNLQPLEKMTARMLGVSQYSLSAELAYSRVEEDARGKGLGQSMFDLRLARIKLIKSIGPKLVFAMSRGSHLKERTGSKVLEYLLGKEAGVNGTDESGKAKISGIEVSVNEISQQLMLASDFNYEQVFEASKAIPHLATKAGMVQIGLFKDLSPIFAVTFTDRLQRELH